MKIFITLDEEGCFVGAFTTKKEALNAKEYPEDTVREYELKISADDLRDIADEEVIGYCIKCDTSLTNNNVVYNSENEPWCCQNCREDVGY